MTTPFLPADKAVPPPHGIALRVSLTESCDLRCTYCRAPSSEDEPCMTRPPLDMAEMLEVIQTLHRSVGIDKLRFTGGEPLLFRELPQLVAASAEFGIRDLSLTTNGQRLASLAGTLKRSGLHRINISLDSLDRATFHRITRGGRLDATLAGIDAALAHGLTPIKLNMVVLRDVNDHECEPLLEFGLTTGCHVRFLELMPIGVAAKHFHSSFVPSQEVRASLQGKYGFTALPGEPAATSRDFLVEDQSGRRTVCGFISPTSEPFCDGCRRLRLTHDGRLLGCLARQTSVDMRAALRVSMDAQPRMAATCVQAALAMKHLPRDLSTQRHMVCIGG